MTDPEKQAFIKLLEDAENGKFYGEIVFKYRAGQCFNIIKGESLMPEDLVKTTR